MKRLLLFIPLVFCLSVQSQTVKTEAGRRIAAIDVEISTIQARIAEASDRRDKLLVKFTTDHINVKAVDAQLAELRQALLIFETERKGLATKEFVRTLPNNNIELLKIIAIQNERIIDLLEQLVKRTP